MEWMTVIRESIRYMEENIMTVSGPAETASHVNISEMYLQRGFQVVTGLTLGEYVRNRKLYMAAIELASTDKKVIDIAYKYGYETPESFTKAFGRFHDASPSEIRKKVKPPRVFLPMRVTLEVKGGSEMDVVIEKKESFELIGIARDFLFETHREEIPRYTAGFHKKYDRILKPDVPAPGLSDLEKALYDNGVGTFGVFTDIGVEQGRCRHMIAGVYKGGKVPEGLEIWKIPEYTWARFSCSGPLPDSVDNVNMVIWNDWLPGNPEYELGGSYIVEKSDVGKDPASHDYRCEIWIPVKKRDGVS